MMQKNNNLTKLKNDPKQITLHPLLRVEVGVLFQKGLAIMLFI